MDDMFAIKSSFKGRPALGLLQQHRKSCVLIQCLASRRSSIATMSRLRAEKAARFQQLVLSTNVAGFSIHLANWQRTESAIRVQALWRMYRVQSKWNDTQIFCCTLQAHALRLMATRNLRLKLSSAVTIYT
jgi:hypothetical protein